MTAATVSIAMTTYKGGKYLQRQLESFASQTRPPDELIITDDDSPDDTVAIIEAFAARAAFEVRLVRNPVRLGCNRNFEKAIALAQGDVVFVSDQDDVWFDDKIATVMTLFEARPDALAVVNDQAIADVSGAETGATVLGNVRKLGYSDLLFGPGCCTALRESLRDLLLPFPGEAVPYDHWINIVPELLGTRLVCETPLQLYRRHGENATESVFAGGRASQWTLAARTDRAGSQAAYRAKIDGNGFIIDRLRERREALASLGLEERIDPAIAELVGEQQDYAARLACLDRGRAARIPMVISMLRNGNYRRFQGFRSALKDLAG